MSFNSSLLSHTTPINLLKKIKFLLLIYLFYYLKMFHLFLSVYSMKKKNLTEMKKD